MMINMQVNEMTWAKKWNSEMSNSKNWTIGESVPNYPPVKRTPPKKSMDMETGYKLINIVDQNTKEIKQKQPEPKSNRNSFLSEDIRRGLEFRKAYDKEFQERRAWLDQVKKENDVIMEIVLNHKSDSGSVKQMSETKRSNDLADVRNASDTNRSQASFLADRLKELTEVKLSKDTPETIYSKEALEDRHKGTSDCSRKRNKSELNRREHPYHGKRNMSDSMLKQISMLFEQRLANLLAGDNEDEYQKENEEPKQNKCENTTSLKWNSPNFKIKVCYSN